MNYQEISKHVPKSHKLVLVLTILSDLKLSLTGSQYKNILEIEDQISNTLGELLTDEYDKDPLTKIQYDALLTLNEIEYKRNGYINNQSSYKEPLSSEINKSISKDLFSNVVRSDNKTSGIVLTREIGKDNDKDKSFKKNDGYSYKLWFINLEPGNGFIRPYADKLDKCTSHTILNISDFSTKKFYFQDQEPILYTFSKKTFRNGTIYLVCDDGLLYTIDETNTLVLAIYNKVVQKWKAGIYDPSFNTKKMI